MSSEVVDIGPLDWRVSIVDKSGRPSPEFQRRWNTSRNNMALIGTVSFGSGAPPPTPVPQDGAQYVDVSVDPFVLYVGYSGTWHKAGVTFFTELNDVPSTYSGAGSNIVRVNTGATALEFVTPASLTANPTAVGGDTAVNGSASTFMRSDAAPAIQKGSSTLFGVVKADNSTVLATSGVLSVPTATTSALGLVKPDGTTITISSGTISGSSPANPTATAKDTAVNGSASTFMRSDAAPAVQKATSSQFGIVKVDGTTITESGGVISASGGGGGGGGMTKISSVVTSGTQSSLTFSSIPSTYTDLMLTWRGRSTIAVNNTGIGMRFNGDTGNNYRWSRENRFGAAIGSAASSMEIGILVGSSASADYVGNGSIIIPGYSSSAFYKSYSGRDSTYEQTGPTMVAEFLGGQWQNTSTVSQIDLFVSGSGGFADGTIFTLYGLG